MIHFPSSRKRKELLQRRIEKDIRAKVCIRLRTACGWLLLTCFLLFLLSHYYLFTPSSMSNIVNYAVSGMRQHEGDLATITFSGGNFSDAALLGAGLAYADGDALYIASPGSPGTVAQKLGYSEPVVESSDEYILAYDRGGTRALLSRSFSLLGELTLTAPIVTGSLADNGYFVLITDEQGYHTACTVYDSQAKEVFQWCSSEYYIISAALSSDKKTLAVLAFRQEDLTMTTHVFFYNINYEEQTVPDALLSDCLGMELIWLSHGAVGVLADNGLHVVRSDGTAEQVLHIPRGDLLAFALHNRMMAVALRSYSGESRSNIYLLRADGALHGPFPLSEEASAVAVSEAGFAALTGSGVFMYRQDASPLWRNAEAVGAKRILLTNDGTIIALFAKYAHLFTEHSRQSEDLSVEE